MERLIKIIAVIFVFISLTLISSCEKEVTTSPPLEPVPFGYLYVDSSPKGMKIYEDGRNSGKVTPDSLNYLPEKEYNITLKRELYRDTSLTVDVVEGIKNTLFVDYYKNPQMMGALKCVSDPENALISLNDSLTDKRTPYIFTDLLPGNYSVKYAYEEHRSRTKEITVKSDHETLAYLKLQDTSLWVDYKLTNSPIPEDYINCMDLDKDNYLWLGVDQYGLVRLKDNVWKTFSTENSPLSDNYVIDIKVDDNNVLWVATYNGLTMKEGDSWTVFNTDNSILESNEITCLNIDADNSLWIGTKNGLYTRRANGAWLKHKSGRSTEVFTQITAVAFDNEGDTWVGTGGAGLARRHNFRWVLYSNIFYERHPTNVLWEDMPGTSISAIVVEEDANRTWFGHLPGGDEPGGISTFNQSTERFSTNSAYVPSPVIHNFNYDDNHNMWFCTDLGLVKWKAHVHQTYFLNWPIKDVAVDTENGIVWVGTIGRGLIKLKKY